jgi:TonB dependent receptor/TonB-dependent Receptor Plug Domain
MMSTGKRLAGLLLLTTSLTLPSVLHAQDAAEETATDELTEQVEETPPEEELQETDISVPGGGIIVTGRRNRDPARNSGQVLNVLSEADIARTGEGDIAGSLARVSGLSLVGNGRVFVRGLGDRYSLALLNGLPLPSPEPLSRVVPLDIFPTSVISSSLVQKTYSANFPGEFGGGVINLTTKAVPTEDFLTIGFSGSGDTETTFENGLTYFGSRWDTFGFDNGNRDLPTALQGLIASGTRVTDAPADVQRQLAGQILPLNLVTLQRNDELPINFSANITGGGSFEVGDGNYVGIIATTGITNTWRNRSVTSQQFGDAEAGDINFDSNNFITDNRVLVNALIGLGLDIGEHTIRWTNLYIRDTLKTARLAQGTDFFAAGGSGADDLGFDFQTQQTAWFERQLLDTQLVAELNFDKLELDLRGGFAQTDREAPFNAIVPYIRTNIQGDPFGDRFVVDVNGNTSGTDDIQVSFEDLTEQLIFGSADLSYELTDDLRVTVGYAYSDTERTSQSFIIRPLLGATAEFTTAVRALGLRRPGDIFNGATLATDANGVGFFNVTVSDPTPFPVFDAALTVHAGYGLFRYRPTETITIEGGVRFEDGLQVAAPDPTFISPGGVATPTRIANEYFLPSATVTWEVIDNLQLRLAASQTIARPQFRELVEQTYFDPESNRRFRGNPFLQDSELINAEARAEYYLGGSNKISLAGFYKEIDNPIENFLITAPGVIETSYANAPSAELYGAEFDVAYGIDLFDWGGFFETKQILILANYTYTQSTISVGAADLAPIPGAPTQVASQLFDEGAPLVGQSDHVANLSLGIEDTDKVQQFTVLLNYASERVTLRGGALPDVVEDPGLTVDVVARSEIKLGGLPLELSLEARNIFGRDNFEFQEINGNRAEINTYDVGTSFSIGLKAQF